MKLPWNKKYLVISFHIVMTIAACYLVYILIDGLKYFFVNFENVTSGISDGISSFISIFSVVLIAFVISYLFDPLVNFFQIKFERLYTKKIRPFFDILWKKKYFYGFYKRFLAGRKNTVTKYKSRTAGTVICFLLLTLIVALSLFLSLQTVLKNSEGSLIESFVSLMNATINEFSDFYTRVQLKIAKWGIGEYSQNIIEQVIRAFGGIFTGTATNLVEILTSTGSFIANFFISLLISFYFLKDKERICAGFRRVAKVILPDKIENAVLSFLFEANNVFSGYIRGQLTDVLIMGILFSVALSFIGIDFAIPIGIFSGLSNIVPYFGAIIAFAVSIFVALLSGEYVKALYAAIVIIILQQIDGIYISPKVIGQNVELSPVMVLISITIGGNLFGILGMIFAVPVCALLKIFFARFVKSKEIEK